MKVKYKLGDKFALYETSVEKSENPDDSVHVRLSVVIGGKRYTAESQESTECAVAALQNALPRNTAIICCQSCVHGNFCAVGNDDDEIFCLSDFEPHTVEDIFHATEDEEERSARSRKLLYVCDRYEEIKEERFSYNDWKYSTKRVPLNDQKPGGLYESPTWADCRNYRR